MDTMGRELSYSSVRIVRKLLINLDDSMNTRTIGLYISNTFAI